MITEPPCEFSFYFHCLSCLLNDVNRYYGCSEGTEGFSGGGQLQRERAQTTRLADELSYVLRTFSSIFALFSLWTKAFTCHHYKHCFSCAVRTRILSLHPLAVTRMSRITRAVTPCDIHHHTQSI